MCLPSFRYYIGTHIFPDVLLNDIAGPDGDPLLLSLKLSVDVLVCNSLENLMSHYIFGGVQIVFFEQI